MPESAQSPSPADLSQDIRRQMGELIGSLNADLTHVDDLRLRTLMQVSAEMLQGIRSAFVRFDEERERLRHLSE